MDVLRCHALLCVCIVKSVVCATQLETTRSSGPSHQHHCVWPKRGQGVIKHSFYCSLYIPPLSSKLTTSTCGCFQLGAAAPNAAAATLPEDGALALSAGALFTAAAAAATLAAEGALFTCAVVRVIGLYRA